jgi:hypothetical protein
MCGISLMGFLFKETLIKSSAHLAASFPPGLRQILSA